jgi:hypothetical protein
MAPHKIAARLRDEVVQASYLVTVRHVNVSDAR